MARGEGVFVAAAAVAVLSARLSGAVRRCGVDGVEGGAVELPRLDTDDDFLRILTGREHDARV